MMCVRERERLEFSIYLHHPHHSLSEFSCSRGVRGGEKAALDLAHCLTNLVCYPPNFIQSESEWEIGGGAGEDPAMTDPIQLWFPQAVNVAKS